MTIQRRKAGSPNGSIHRTFRAIFEMPTTPFNHNIIKIGKQRYRNPICLAKEWRRALDYGEYASLAALANHLKVSRSRVTQIMNLLKLSPEVIEILSSLGDSTNGLVLAERRLRPMLSLTAEQQKAQVKLMLLKNRHNQP